MKYNYIRRAVTALLLSVLLVSMCGCSADETAAETAQGTESISTEVSVDTAPTTVTEVISTTTASESITEITTSESITEVTASDDDNISKRFDEGTFCFANADYGTNEDGSVDMTEGTLSDYIVFCSSEELNEALESYDRKYGAFSTDYMYRQISEAYGESYLKVYNAFKYAFYTGRNWIAIPMSEISDLAYQDGELSPDLYEMNFKLCYAVMSDSPMLNATTLNWSLNTIINNKYSIAFQYGSEEYDILGAYELLEEYAAKIPDEAKTDPLSIADWYYNDICNNVYYDKDYLTAKTNLYQILEEHIGKCNGISSVFQAMLNYYGMDSIGIVGYERDGKEGHQWVYADIGGRWRFFDPTNDLCSGVLDNVPFETRTPSDPIWYYDIANRPFTHYSSEHYIFRELLPCMSTSPDGQTHFYISDPIADDEGSEYYYLAIDRTYEPLITADMIRPEGFSGDVEVTDIYDNIGCAAIKISNIEIFSDERTIYIEKGQRRDPENNLS